MLKSLFSRLTGASAVPKQTENKRINEQLLAYWEKKRNGRRFPAEPDIDPSEIAAIWDSCFLVQVMSELPESARFKYIYLGQSLVNAYGDDLGNKEVCEKLIYPGDMSLIHHFQDVIRTEQPLTEESEFENINGMLIKFRSCMLPLGKVDDSHVSYIIGGMKWKAF